jgi:GT2 family glycosyltransferase
VSVVVLNWNGLQDSLECINSLLSSAYPRFRVVFVDNGSNVDEAAIVAQAFGSSVDVIRSLRNLGFAGGTNLGLRRALELPSDYVFLANNDMVFASECISSLVEVIESHSEALAVVPFEYVYANPASRRFPSGMYRLSPLWHVLLQPLSPFLNRFVRVPEDGLVRLGVLETGLAMMRRSLIEALGTLDPIYFFGGGENLEISLCVARLGGKIFAVPRAKLWHKGAMSLGGTEKAGSYNTYRGVMNRIIFARKNLRNTAKILSLIVILAVHAPLLALHRVLMSRRIGYIATVVQGVRDGLKHPLPRLGRP